MNLRPPFGNLVCNALESGRQVSVALERPTAEQPYLQAILTSNIPQDAEKALLEQAGWHSTQDGRSSHAMLRLLLTLRELRKIYPTLQVYAVDGPFYNEQPSSRDEAIGKSVLALSPAAPSGLTLVLTGNVHAMQAPMFGFPTSAMVLPRSVAVSLEITDAKGSQAWNCVSSGCGSHPSGVPDKDSGRIYGIYLDPTLAPIGRVDGIFALKTPLTSSPPAINDVH